MRFSRGILVATLFLSACSWGNSPGVLPPEEVLKNAARASQALDSANYVLTGRYAVTGEANQTSSGDIRMEGAVSHSGEQLQFVLTINGDIFQASQKSDLTGTLEIIVAGIDAVYMKLHSLILQPSNDLFRPDLIAQFAGKWWLLPTESQVAGVPTTSPDPRILQAQSQVVRVEKDHGIETLNGRQVYFYTVALDKEKLLVYLETLAQEKNETFDRAAVGAAMQQLEGAGELWIDAETFQLHRVKWDVKNVPFNTLGGADATFTVDFTNHNRAAPIQIPTDAQPFSPTSFLGVPAPEFPEQALPGVPAELEQQMIDELLRNMQTQ